jgi:hypothetical protein
MDGILFMLTNVCDHSTDNYHMNSFTPLTYLPPYTVTAPPNFYCYCTVVRASNILIAMLSPVVLYQCCAALDI